MKALMLCLLVLVTACAPQVRHTYIKPLVMPEAPFQAKAYTLVNRKIAGIYE